MKEYFFQLQRPFNLTGFLTIGERSLGVSKTISSDFVASWFVLMIDFLQRLLERRHCLF